MSQIKTTEIEGDVAIGRHVTAGGNATIQGNATVKKNLKIEGWLDARNIKGPNKGIFLTAEKLREAYPLPHDGWWALVGNTLPAPLYIADGGAWVATGESAGNPTIDSQQYNDAVAALDADLKKVAGDVTANKASIEQIRTQVNGIGTQVNTLNNDVGTLKTDVAGMKTRLTKAETDITTAQTTANNAMPLRIALADLDTFGTDGTYPAIMNFVRNSLHSRLRVTVSKDDPRMVGYLDIFMDSMNHVITQVFTTHLIPDTDGTISGSSGHQCESAFTYFRAYNINAPQLDNERFTWTAWHKMSIELGHTSDVAFPGDEGAALQKLAEGVKIFPYDTTCYHKPELNERPIGTIAFAYDDHLFYIKTGDEEWERYDAYHTTKDFKTIPRTDCIFRQGDTLCAMRLVEAGTSRYYVPEAYVIGSGEFDKIKQRVSDIAILPFNGIMPSIPGAQPPRSGIWFRASTDRTNGAFQFHETSELYSEADYNTTKVINGSTTTVAREDRIFRSGNDLYKYDGKMLTKIGGASVGNTYNVTVELPLADGEYYSDIVAEEQVHNVLQAVYDAGMATPGLQITFAIGPGSWKTYQYIGPNETEAQFVGKPKENWIDLAGMSAGTEPVININQLCGDKDYTLSTAVQALIDYEGTSGINYRKEGLVITYRRNSEPIAWETKQYQGSIHDMQATNEAQWKDFGGGGDKVETTDTPEKDSTKAITAGGVYDAFQTEPIVDFDDLSDAENYILQGVNHQGNAVGNPIKIPRSNGTGTASGSTLNIYPESQAVWGAYGGRIALRAAIKSVSFDGDTEIPGTIKTISILDALTKIVLWSEVVNAPSSTSATNYTFEFDFTDFITGASSKDFIIAATDADGNEKTRVITCTAVDVTCTCIQSLSYAASTSLEVGGREKSLPMYKFENNVSTKQGILVTTEIFYNGEWKVLGTATVTDQYSHNISINPTNVFGNSERLTHGAYPLRIQGKDLASGVTGNIIYTAVMCIDPANSTPVVAMRYDDNNDGNVRLYDSLSVDVAAYTPGKTQTPVEVVMDGVVVTSVNCGAGQSYKVSKQVQGFKSDGTKQLDIFARSGESKSVTVTLKVEGSAIDASVKEGAVFAYDFSTRSNNETDHTIKDGDYTMNVEGSNWNSNGFVTVLGETALRIAENVKAEIPYAPFSSSALETAGAAIQLAFSTKSIKDKNAMLCECYDPTAGVGFYIRGNEAVLTVLNGTPKRQRVGFKSGEKITIAIVVEPGSKYVTYKPKDSASGVDYSFVKMYINGEECAAIGYQPGTSALRQNKTIKFNSESGDFALNYIMAYNSYMEWLQAFRNYLCKLSDVRAMIAEYDRENVLDTIGKPSMSLMAAKGMPYYVIVADQTTFNNFDYALNGGTSTSDQFACTLYYFNPQHPEVNFKAINTLWRRQGTTSAQRPIKNDRFNFNKKNKATGLKATVTLLNPDDSTELGRKAITAAKHNKVFVSETGMFVDVITVKVDYSDSSNANDCGVCDMMNATFRALGSAYQTPAQRAYDGTQDLGGGDVLTGLQMDHSTKNHPIAAFRATTDTLQDAWFHAKANWKEDKGEQTALGFKNTPGYNLGCLNYGDFVEYFGTADETLAQTEARFKADPETNTDKAHGNVYLISQYCGRDYAIYRYKNGAWTRSTGSMKQVNGKWQVTGDVLNPVTGFELLQYAGMDWWQGVATVEDMMKPSTQTSSWVKKLGLAATEYPAWTYYFECMVDDDQLQEDLALGKKVPYDLFNMLRFFDSCDFSKVEGWQDIWKKNAFRYMSLESAMAYTAFTDFLAAVDQRAKNMQPMFFLEDGCSVENGVYSGTRTMEPLRMYLNKVYDCDTCNGADNDGGRDIDPEVDPNKPTDEEAGYTNPYMGRGSVLFNNMDKQQECWNSNDLGVTTISLKSVVNRMRNQTSEIDGKTMVPFSPDGALYFFVESKLMFWPKVISSYDGERKYIDNTGIANLPYFYALHGLGLTTLPRFIEQRWAIRDGYYQTGDFFTNPLSGRVSAISEDSKIYITASATGYFGIGNDASGQLSEVVFLEAGQSHAFTRFAHDAGALLYIYQPNRMSKIDLSEMTLAFHFDDLSKLELCEEIILGGAKHTANTSLNGFNSLGSIVLGDMPFLRKLDVSGTTATSIDAKGCPRLESVLANDTALTTCNIAQTSPIEELTLPGTMTSMELVNLPNLTYPGGLNVESVSNINRLWVEGCPFIDTEELVMSVAEAGAIREVRIPDINMTASVAVLRQLRRTGAIGLDEAGKAYEESGQCSGITGRWILSELIDEADMDGEAGLNTLAQYFPELDLINSQFSMLCYSDNVDDCENITNLDNKTGCLFNNDFVPSGHFKKLEEMSHAVKGTYNNSTGVMTCEPLLDDDYNYMANGTSIDLTDSSGMGYDIFKHIPSHYYKGVNDFKNQTKYSLRSICTEEPISTATQVKRAQLPDLVVETNAALILSENPIGSEPITSLNAAMSVYEMDVQGMKQVRWPGINNDNLGCVFLNAEGKIISQFKMSLSHAQFDFMAGEDYIFCDVPAGAVKFMFTAQTSCNDNLVIAVDSNAIEAIEPDWVFRKEFLVGVYGMGQDGLNRARSISGTKAVVGDNNSTTSSAWTYDANGRVTNLSVPTGLHLTRQDCINLCEMRGPGFHAISYEQSKDLANIIMELVGNRDIQAVCGRGCGAGYNTGTQTINGKNINAWGNQTLVASGSGFGNLMFGIQNFVACNYEWMAHIAMNVSSFMDWKAKKCPTDDATYPIDCVMHIYDVQTDTERAVQATPSGNGYCISRVRHGRYMDTIAGKCSSDNSAWNKNYSDKWEYSAGRCRVVGRANDNANANGGLVYAYASYVSAYSSTVVGSRLAFSGPIEMVTSD